jgi:SOS-response transcriptional repressor LexA
MTRSKTRPAFPEEFARFLTRKVGPTRAFATQKALAEAAGVSPSNLSNLKKGVPDKPSPYILERLSRMLNEYPNYLHDLWAYCKGISDIHPEEMKSLHKVMESSERYATHGTPRRLPVVPAASDEIRLWAQDSPPAHQAPETAPSDIANPSAFFIRAEEGLLSGPASGINDGDLILVEPGIEIENGDLVIYAPDDAEVTLGRLYQHDDGSASLISLAKKSAPLHLKANDQVLCFPIVEIRKMLK